MTKSTVEIQFKPVVHLDNSVYRVLQRCLTHKCHAPLVVIERGYLNFMSKPMAVKLDGTECRGKCIKCGRAFVWDQAEL